LKKRIIFSFVFVLICLAFFVKAQPPLPNLEILSGSDNDSLVKLQCSASGNAEFYEFRNGSSWIRSTDVDGLFDWSSSYAVSGVNTISCRYYNGTLYSNSDVRSVEIDHSCGHNFCEDFTSDVQKDPLTSADWDVYKGYLELPFEYNEESIFSFSTSINPSDGINSYAIIQIAELSDGNLALIWLESRDNPVGMSTSSAQVAKYSPDGTLISGPHQIDIYFEAPRTTMITKLNNGGFVVVCDWGSHSTAHVFDSNGDPYSNFMVTETFHSNNFQHATDVLALKGINDGNFVVFSYGQPCWGGPGCSGNTINAKVFDLDGNVIKAFFYIEPYGGYGGPSLMGAKGLALNNGGFLAVYPSFTEDPGTGDILEEGFYGKNYDSYFNQVGNKFLITNASFLRSITPIETSGINNAREASYFVKELRDNSYEIIWDNGYTITPNNLRHIFRSKIFDSNFNQIGSEAQMDRYFESYGGVAYDLEENMFVECHNYYL
jgi:hypothetical protein